MGPDPRSPSPIPPYLGIDDHPFEAGGASIHAFVEGIPFSAEITDVILGNDLHVSPPCRSGGSCDDWGHTIAAPTGAIVPMVYLDDRTGTRSTSSAPLAVDSLERGNAVFAHLEPTSETRPRSYPMGREIAKEWRARHDSNMRPSAPQAGKGLRKIKGLRSRRGRGRHGAA